MLKTFGRRHSMQFFPAGGGAPLNLVTDTCKNSCSSSERSAQSWRRVRTRVPVYLTGLHGRTRKQPRWSLRRGDLLLNLNGAYIEGPVGQLRRSKNEYLQTGFEVRLGA